MTKGELEALVKHQKLELRMCHKVIEKLGADFRAAEEILKKAAILFRQTEEETK